MGVGGAGVVNQALQKTGSGGGFALLGKEQGQLDAGFGVQGVEHEDALKVELGLGPVLLDEGGAGGGVGKVGLQGRVWRGLCLCGLKRQGKE